MDISKMKVVSIDDNENNLLMIEAFTNRLNLMTRSFMSPLEALEYVKNNKYDIIIVDYMMPNMDGIEFIEAFRKLDVDTPIIMITAVGDDPKLHLKALEIGATDFLTKPVNGAIFKARITNLLKLKKSYKLIANKAELLQSEVDRATRNIIMREMEALDILGKTSEYKDPETNAHVMRVACYSKIIGKYYGLSENMIDILFHAAPLHDIGKIGIPDHVLLKPGKLDQEEWNTMQTHSRIGYDILQGSKSQYLKAGSVIAFTHHERFNGKGYPKGLSGETIPIFGRIVAIADVFDALCTKRPYKEPWSFEKAAKYIEEEKGQHFDPKCVQCFTDHLDEIEKVYNTYKN